MRTMLMRYWARLRTADGEYISSIRTLPNVVAYAVLQGDNNR